MAAPVGAWGLGLGDIDLQSSLNQPFRAEIEVTATAEELESLDVSLAGQEAFDRYGLFRSQLLSSLNFEVTRDASGQNIVVVTSNEPITEPFVTMLLEASWSRGRVLREYTALLDPPTMLPGPEGPVPVETPESGDTGERAAGGAIEREPAAEPAAPRPAEPDAPAPAPRAAEASRSEEAGTYGPVQRGETLWSIANEFRPSGVSMNQMLVGLYGANPNAFDGNMNMLQRGAILQIPSQSELSAISDDAALAEVTEQSETWDGGERLTLRPVTEEQAVAGQGARESDEASGQSAAEVEALRSEVASLESELEESQRVIELRDQELAELQSRLAALEEAVESAPGGAGEREASAGDEPDADEPVFADEGGAAGSADGAGGAGAGGADAPASSDAGAEADGSQAAAESPAPAPVAAAPEEPSLVSRALGWLARPLVWIGLGLAVVLLAGFGYVRRRRAEFEDVTGRWEALEAEAAAEEAAGADRSSTARLHRRIDPADEDFVVEETSALAQAQAGAAEQSAEQPAEPAAAASHAADTRAGADEGAEDTLSSQTVMNLDQADPVAEADFHMAYGLYDQAADLMTKALESDPGNRAYKLKLLEVYFVWGNKEAFLETARDVRADMGAQTDTDWDKIIIMGQQICPDEPMFADAQAAAGEVDLDLDAGSSGLNFALGDESGVSAGAGDESSALDEVFGAADEDAELSLEPGDGRDEGYKSWRDAPQDEDVLSLGETTAAGIDAAFADDETQSGAGGASAHAETQSLDPTQESPTIEQPRGDADAWADDDDEWSITTQESPTIENAGFESPTVESSQLDDDGDDTGRHAATGTETAAFEAPSFGQWGDDTSEAPTVEQPAAGGGDTSEAPTVEQPAAESSGEYTAELDLDDLGLDVSDFDRLPDDLGDAPAAADAESGDTRDQPAMSLDDDGDDQLLSATGVTEVLGDEEPDFDAANTGTLDDDNNRETMAPGVGGERTDFGGERTEFGGGRADAGGEPADVGGESTGERSGLDFDLGDMSSSFDEGDTVEQPQVRSFDSEDDIFAGSEQTPVDLDVGSDVQADEEPTDTRSSQPDPETMTEVGTKLDLARAYVDMGDPEGARSILEEVLDEGDTGQRHEAQTLLDSLSA